MFVGINFLGQTVSFGICSGVVFSHDKIHCLDPSKQPRVLANLWTLASLATQIQNAKLRLRLYSAFGFFNLASLGEKPGQMALVIFQGLENFIYFKEKTKKPVTVNWDACGLICHVRKLPPDKFQMRPFGRGNCYPRTWQMLYFIKITFVTFVGNNFLGQMVSFGICQGVVFSRDNI